MRWYILYNETRISPDITFNVGESTYFSLRFAGCKERFLIYAVTIRYKDLVFDHKSFSIRILVAIGHYLENLSTLSSPKIERNRICPVTLR